MPEPAELKEYHYMVGHVEHSAMLTPKMAERLGAKPIDEPLDDTKTGEVTNNEAQRMSTATREADDAGVTNEDNEKTAEKTRVARNKRATGV
jgi:hypothetical protein